jgi:hypothetical protein
LVDLMRNGFPDAVRAAAANALPNRGWGLPRQAIDVSPAPPKPINRMSLEKVEAEIARLEERSPIEQENGACDSSSGCEPERAVAASGRAS